MFSSYLVDFGANKSWLWSALLSVGVSVKNLSPQLIQDGGLIKLSGDGQTIPVRDGVKVGHL